MSDTIYDVEQPPRVVDITVTFTDGMQQHFHDVPWKDWELTDTALSVSTLEHGDTNVPLPEGRSRWTLVQIPYSAIRTYTVTGTVDTPSR